MERTSQERSALVRTIRSATLAASLLLVSCTGSPEPEAPITSEVSAPEASLIESVTVERPLTEPESLALHQQATIQLRSARKNAKGTGAFADTDDLYGVTDQNCTATHVGSGWFVTAGHCFGSQFEVADDNPVPAQPSADVYDVSTEIPDFFTAWREEAEGWKHLGNIDSVVINGNYSQGDFAMVHVIGGEVLPSVKLADTEPISTGRYFITGYPGLVGYQMQYPIEYRSSLTAGDIQDDFGLSSDVMLQGFADTTDTRNAETLCQPGMSGSTVIDSEGKVYGVLSRVGDSPSLIGQILGSGKETDMKNHMYCGVMPISSELVDSYKAKKGQPAQENTYIVVK